MPKSDHSVNVILLQITRAHNARGIPIDRVGLDPIMITPEVFRRWTRQYSNTSGAKILIKKYNSIALNTSGVQHATPEVIFDQSDASRVNIRTPQAFDF